QLERALLRSGRSDGDSPAAGPGGLHSHSVPRCDRRHLSPRWRERRPHWRGLSAQPSTHAAGLPVHGSVIDGFQRVPGRAGPADLAQAHPSPPFTEQQQRGATIAAALLLLLPRRPLTPLDCWWTAKKTSTVEPGLPSL